MITLTPTEDQRELVGSVESFLAKELPLNRVRELADTPDGVSDDLWGTYAELGWFGLAIPEESGGIGLGIPEESLLMIEAGRRLVPGPLRSTIVAARIAAAAGEVELLDRLLSGELRAGFAVGDLSIDVRAGDALVTLDHDRGTIRIVDAVDPARPVDPTTRVARATAGKLAAEAAGPFRSIALVLASAELLGVIEAVRDMSAAYAAVRTQFDRPIGSFQAVKHRCAEMAVGAYAVRAQVLFAALRLEMAGADAEFQARAAFELATGRAQTAVKDNIQNHGGVGFTWEHPAHLYLKRAYLLSRLFGTSRETRSAMLAAEPSRFD
ncbi:MAG: acyl-CoA dehydrogenase family protein [Microbacterium sp.]